MPTRTTLLRAGRALRRIAGHGVRPPGAGVGRDDAIWRGLGAGGRGWRARARDHHKKGWSGGVGPSGVTPSSAVNIAAGGIPIGITGARHKPTAQQRWIYTFYLNYYVTVTDDTGQSWRLGVRANVHVSVRNQYSLQLKRDVPVYTNVKGHAYIPGYDCWQMETPAAIVGQAPAYDPNTHATYVGTAGWGNAGDFYTGTNRYPTPT